MNHDEKDGGINPLFAGAFSEAALDAPAEIVVQHAGGRGFKAACGDVGGQHKPAWLGLSGVTCPQCIAIKTKRTAGKRGGR